MAAIVAISIALVPVLVSVGGQDWFRLIKELGLRAEAIIVVAFALTALLLLLPGSLRSYAREIPKPLAFLIFAVVIWGAVSAVASTNRLLSRSALAYVASALVVFMATYVVSSRRTVTWLIVPIVIGSLPNAILALLQASSIWNPFTFDPTFTTRMRTSGLMGNPDDVGTYLTLATLLIVFAVFAGKGHKWLWIAAGATAAGVFASGSLTAILALMAGMFVLAAIVAGPRRRWAGVAVVAAVSIAATFLLPFLRHRAMLIQETFRTGDYVTLTSRRIYAFGPAWSMFLEKPFTGVGPGAFKFNYLQYRQAFDEQHPRYWWGTPVENYAEVHSDHLQILAEEGLPGYAIFLAALVILALPSFQKAAAKKERPQSAFSRVAALPFAASIAVLAIAGFPLELAAPTQLLLHGAAGILSWSRH